MAVERMDLAGTLRGLAAAVGADAGAQLLMDRGDGVLELAADEAARGPSQESVAAAMGRLLRNLRRPANGTGAIALVSVPDVRGGLLLLQRTRPVPFSAEDLAVARLYARQLADQVVNGPGPRHIAWSSQLEAVQGVAAELTRLTTVEDVAAALCTQTRRVIAYDNARVYVICGDGVSLEPVAFRPHAREYTGETAEGLRVRVGEGITGWVAATGEALIVPDSARDPRGLDIPGGEEVTEESMLLAPLRSEGRAIGVVVLSRLGLDRFGEDDLRLLRILTDQAAVAIENARLLAARERLVAEMGTLLDISRAGAQATDENQLAGQLAAKLRAAAAADACVISRLDDATTELVRLGADGVDDDPARWDYQEHPIARSALLEVRERPVRLAATDVDGPELERLTGLGGASAMLFPMTASGRVIGLIELVWRGTQGAADARQADLLSTMANQAAAVLENSHLVARLRRAAEVDAVSGVFSHRHLQERLPQEIARAARARAPLSLLMVDLDDFKHVNDRHGHQVGDRVLGAIAGCLRGAVRASDVVARYGGDEFVILMPDADADAAEAVARRVIETVARVSHPMTDGPDERVSCSIGVAVYPRDGRTSQALLRAADTAMYERKRTRQPVVARQRRTSDTSAA